MGAEVPVRTVAVENRCSALRGPRVLDGDRIRAAR
jgi:hypothetical protein